MKQPKSKKILYCNILEFLIFSGYTTIGNENYRYAVHNPQNCSKLHNNFVLQIKKSKKAVSTKIYYIYYKKVRLHFQFLIDFIWTNKYSMNSPIEVTIWNQTSLLVAFSFAVQTDGFSLVTSFGTGLNSIFAINITVFHCWVVRAKGTKSALSGAIVTSRTFRA